RARPARARARRVLWRRADLARDARAAADDPGVLAAARAVLAPDRVQPDRPADLRVRDLGRAQVVLHAFGGPGRKARARRAAPGGRPGARRSLRRRLHRPPARELPAGRAP